jgi:hypothetical protein
MWTPQQMFVIKDEFSYLSTSQKCDMQLMFALNMIFREICHRSKMDRERARGCNKKYNS